MRTSEFVQCQAFPCADVRHDNYILPDIELEPENISLILISEAAPAEPKDFYYTGPGALFEQTTLLAFQDAGVQAVSIQDLLARGVYFTTAVKCGKTGYAIQARTIETCSHLLEQELSLFPNAKALLLMGDVAIKALNNITLAMRLAA